MATRKKRPSKKTRPTLKSIDAKIDGVKSGLEAKIDGVKSGLEAKIDGVKSGLEAKIDGVKSELEAKIDGVKSGLEAKIDGVESGLEAKIDGVKSGLDAKIDGVESRLDAKIDRVDRANHERLDDAVHVLRSEIRHLASETRAGFTNLNEKVKDIPLMKVAIVDLAAEMKEHRLELEKKADLEHVERVEARVTALESKAG